MTLPTLSLLKVLNILVNTCRKGCKKMGSKKNLSKGWIMREGMQINGMDQKLEGNGIANEQKSNSQMRNQRLTNANGAETSLKLSLLETISFAQINVKQHIGITQDSIMKRGDVNGAAMNLLQTNTVRPNFVVEVAADNILQASELKGIEIVREDICNVYDIEVEDMHEFFANGVLVHNCIDPIRYYILGHILGRILKPKDLTGIFNH